MEVILLILLMICIVVFLIVVHDMTHVRTVQYEITSEKLEKDTTIALLSDLHNHNVGKDNTAILKAVYENKPDAIVIAGDLITADGKMKDQNTMTLLKGLCGKYPIYYGYGNHETKLRERENIYGDYFKQYQRKLKKMGIRLLDNERVIIPETNIEVVGFHTPLSLFQHFCVAKCSKDVIKYQVGEAKEEHFELLIAHNPDHFESYDEWGADLTVSGHQHGGIARIPFLGGVISTGFRLFPKYDGGLFEGKHGIMIISRGLGTHTIPVRFNNPCELVIIHLKKTVSDVS